MPKIVTNDLRLAFGGEQVLRGLNAVVERGEFVSILGTSGCGKSTFLRILAGLLQPTSGTVMFDGESRHPGQTSFVFQKPTLCPWLSLRRNVELPLKLSHTSASSRTTAVEKAIELVGLDKSDRSKLPRQLSGGMQMRASLARAFVTKPSLMLMDEPFSSLDEVMRQQLTETSLRLWQLGNWTTVFVTHNVAEAVFVSQRIYILAGKPATFVECIDVPFRERNEDLRTSPEFIEFVADVSQRFRTAVERPPTIAEADRARGGEVCGE